jgi:hypothetical protein
MLARLAAPKALAAAITQLPAWLPAQRDGRTLEDGSVLGPLFGIAAIPDTGGWMGSWLTLWLVYVSWICGKQVPPCKAACLAASQLHLLPPLPAVCSPHRHCPPPPARRCAALLQQCRCACAAGLLRPVCCRFLSWPAGLVGLASSLVLLSCCHHATYKRPSLTAFCNSPWLPLLPCAQPAGGRGTCGRACRAFRPAWPSCASSCTASSCSSSKTRWGEGEGDGGRQLVVSALLATAITGKTNRHLQLHPVASYCHYPPPVSQDTREAMLGWLAAALNSNLERAKMRPDPRKSATDGFVLNLAAVRFVCGWQRWGVELWGFGAMIDWARAPPTASCSTLRRWVAGVAVGGVGCWVFTIYCRPDPR